LKFHQIYAIIRRNRRSIITRKDFVSKISGFVYLTKMETGVDLGCKYVEDEVIGFYARYRYIPQLYVNRKTGSFGMK